MRNERPWPTKSDWVTRAEYHCALKQAPFKALTRRIVDTVADFQNDGENMERAFPSLTTIAKDAGCDVSAVKKHLVIAEDSGWIERRPRFPNAKESVNEYQLLIPANIDRKALRYPGSIGAYPGSINTGPGSNEATKVLKEGQVKSEQVKGGNSAYATLRPFSRKAADPDSSFRKKYLPDMPDGAKAWGDRHEADYDLLKEVWETHCCEWTGEDKPTGGEGMKKFYALAKFRLRIDTKPPSQIHRPQPATIEADSVPY